MVATSTPEMNSGLGAVNPSKRDEIAASDVAIGAVRYPLNVEVRIKRALAGEVRTIHRDLRLQKLRLQLRQLFLRVECARLNFVGSFYSLQAKLFFWIHKKLS